MVDLIDRQAAIDAIVGITNCGSLRKLYEYVVEHDIKDRWSGGLVDAADAVIGLPSADIDLSGFSDKLWKKAYERGKAEVVRWIPVSEQLPEDNQEVLFSTKTGWVHLGRYYNDNSVNQWYSSLEKMRVWNNVVNAWMPLPEPYKDGEQDG